MPTLLDHYLRDIGDIRSSGAAAEEVSFYPALSRLLGDVGRKLKPKVFCVSQPKGNGAGHPDFSLYTASQFRKANLREPIPEQLPERGVVEVKPVGDDVHAAAASDRVTRYWERYRLVLVTNYRAFILVGRDQSGRRINLEHFELADVPDAFWALAASPNRAPEVLSSRFEEFVKRALLHNATLTNPKDVAWFLGSYARDALARVEENPRLEGLLILREALEKALGMTFEGPKGDHFYHSSLVQTLFYGLFSAWVMWCKKTPEKSRRRGFDALSAPWHERLPVLQVLFEFIDSPSRLGALKLVEVVDWAAAALRRVDDEAFFKVFREEHAVQYFYEPFLKAFDPDLRKQLGVWYTPPEVVDYMVERVDAVLRSELGLADGLAGDNVYVLDPCAGTGSYIISVLKRIEKTLGKKHGDALVGEKVKTAALDRIFGFEILPAPFVVAHMQVGLYLEGLGVPLGKRVRLACEEEELPAIHLTNALTDWEDRQGPGPRLPFPELQQEMERARAVKRQTPILVVLGNPPYNGYAGVAMAEERALTGAYRTVNRVRRPEGQGLNDLYVRFFRMAERRIADFTGQGVICFISNYSWLDGLSFTGMRERYLDAFDKVWIDCLNGDKYKTGKLTPDGNSDPSVFSTEFNRQGIQVGTAIALMVRKDPSGRAAAIRFRHLWGGSKRDELKAAAQDGESLYEAVQPPLAIGLPFFPSRVNESYFAWPLLPELMPVSYPGVKTSRDGFLVDIDRQRLERRLEKYFDPDVAHREMRRIAPVAMKNTARFKAEKVRDLLRKRGLLHGNIVRYCYRPFDVRWLYWEPETKLLDEKRAEYFPNLLDRNRAEYVSHVAQENIWLIAAQKLRRETSRPQVITRLGCSHLMERGANCFPVFLREGAAGTPLFDAGGDGGIRPNLTALARRYLASVGAGPLELFHHLVAVLHSPAFEKENGDALRQDWPRLPLPASGEALESSAELGRRVAALLDSERPVDGVTAGTVRPELRFLGLVGRLSGGSLGEKDLRLEARWGYAGMNGVTMPGHGRTEERDYSGGERAAVADGAAALGLSSDAALALLGGGVRDVYLNDSACWRCVPERVWAYAIGGYQVIKKWLSYRQYELLGRPLGADEAHQVAAMVRRLAALLLMAPRLDANYRSVRGKFSGEIR